MPLQTPLLAVVLALLIAAAVLAALWRPWIKSDVLRPAWAGALALAAAFVVSDYLIWRNWPGLWSAEEQRRLWLVAAGALGVSVLDSFPGGRIAGTWKAWAAGAVLLLPLVWSDASDTGKYPHFLLWWLLYAGAIALLWSEIATAHKRVGGVRVPLVLCVAAGGTCVAIAQTYSASIGLMGASVAAAMGAVVALAVWRPTLPAVVGAAPVYAALLVGLFVGALYGGVKIQLWSFIFCVLSAATGGLGDRGPLRGLKPWIATLACVLLTLALAALAVWNAPKGFDFGGA